MARPERNWRMRARASRDLGGTCETWVHARAPEEKLATTGATHVRPDGNLRQWARASRALEKTREVGTHTHRAPWT